MNARRILLALCMVVVSVAMSAQKSFDVNLWEGKMPGKSGDATDVPVLKVFLPAAKKATGRAVVICPGGGYEHLCMDYEGTEWAPFLNDMGIAAIVLKYRMPHGNPSVPRRPYAWCAATPTPGTSTPPMWALWASLLAAISPPPLPFMPKPTPVPTFRCCSIQSSP